MKKGLIFLGIFVLLLSGLPFISSADVVYGVCIGTVDCEAQCGYDDACCAEYGCSTDMTIPEPPPGTGHLCYNLYPNSPSCSGFNQATCTSTAGCTWTCCTGSVNCAAYLDSSSCGAISGCVWTGSSSCNGGEISGVVGGLTCGDLTNKELCEHYDECTWGGGACTGSSSCTAYKDYNDANKATCTNLLGCSWQCTPCDYTWYIDIDKDSYRSATSEGGCDRPGYSYSRSVTGWLDCNDYNPFQKYYEICNDGRDNDCDGIVDCEDPYCENTCPYCPTIEICDDDEDNDCDGLTDCDDVADCPSELPTDPCYVCTPVCDDFECGDDGCGGVCGTCPEGETCIDGICVSPNPYWADEDEDELITPPTLEISFGYQIKMVVENSGLSQGNVDFEVYEDDWASDDDIRTGANAITGTVDANGKAVAIWTITEEDLIAASSQFMDEESDIYEEFEFFFKVNGIESGIIYIQYVLGVCDGINICDDYGTSQANCIADVCGVRNNTAGCDPETDICLCEFEEGACIGNVYEEPDINNNLCVYCIDGPDSGDWCDITGENDYCDTTESCSGDIITNSVYCTIESAIGSCIYLTDDSSDPLGCEDDGYLSYSWQGNWDWNVINDYPSNPDEEDFYYHESSWRYDPLRLSTECNSEGGTTKVLCPAQIELPFFKTWNILIAVALIIVIYVILGMKHKTKKRKK